MKRYSQPVVAFVFALLVACGEDLVGPLEQGIWGGVGVGLTVQADSALIEFDCAHGVIEAPLMLEDGRFSLPGRFVLEHGGPVIEGEEPDVRAATYHGAMRDRILDLTVAVEGLGGDLGPYLLRRGDSPQLRKCL